MKLLGPVLWPKVARKVRKKPEKTVATVAQGERERERAAAGERREK